MIHEQKSQGSPRDVSLAVVILAGFCALFAIIGWGNAGIDLDAIYLASWLAGAGQGDLLYAAVPSFVDQPVDPAWREGAEAAAMTASAPVAYVYPPIWAHVLGPVAQTLDHIAFSNLTRVILGAAYAATLVAVWRLMRPRLSLPRYLIAAIALTTTTLPLVFAWSLLQPHFIIVALLAWSFERYSAGKSTAAGVLLGLAAAVKVTPILFVLLFAADRNWRATACALGTSGGIAALSVLALGWAPHAAFLEAAAFLNTITIFYGGNLTFEVVLQALLYPAATETTAAGMQFAAKTAWIGALSKAMLVVAAGLILWHTRQLPHVDRVSRRALFLVPVLYFFSPLAWGHYYLLLLPMILGLTGQIQARYLIASLATGFAMFFLPLFFFIQQSFPNSATLQYVQSLALAFSLLSVALGLRHAARPHGDANSASALPA